LWIGPAHWSGGAPGVSRFDSTTTGARNVARARTRATRRGPFPSDIGPRWRRSVSARARPADLERVPAVTRLRTRTVYSIAVQVVTWTEWETGSSEKVRGDRGHNGACQRPWARWAGLRRRLWQPDECARRLRRRARGRASSFGLFLSRGIYVGRASRIGAIAWDEQRSLASETMSKRAGGEPGCPIPDGNDRGPPAAMAESDGDWPKSRSTPLAVGDRDELSVDRGHPDDDETERRFSSKRTSRDSSRPDVDRVLITKAAFHERPVAFCEGVRSRVITGGPRSPSGTDESGWDDRRGELPRLSRSLLDPPVGHAERTRAGDGRDQPISGVSVRRHEGVSLCLPVRPGPRGEGGLQLASRAAPRIVRARPADPVCDRPSVSLGG